MAYVDSDDAVLPDFIETLYDLADRYQADIAACAYERGKKKATDAQIKIDIHVANKFRDKNANGVADRDDHSKYDGSVTELCMTSEQMLRQWHGRYKKWETVAWNKLYRKRILDGLDGSDAIRFPIGRRHEDVLTRQLIVANAEREDRVFLETAVLAGVSEPAYRVCAALGVDWVEESEELAFCHTIRQL